MADMTPRLSLPLLAAGQAQKELFHNEALATLDTLVQACVQSAGTDDPPPGPAIGQSWIVGPAPTGAWTGVAGSIAIWTEGGWRFVTPVEGTSLWVADVMLPALYRGGAWEIGQLHAAGLLIGGHQVVGERQPGIAAPSDGATVDGEARAAIAAVIVALETHGLISV